MPMNETDELPPSLLFWTILSNAKNDDNLILYFNEDVIAGNGDIIISNGIDTRVIPVSDTSQVTFSSKAGESHSSINYGKQVTINPSADLIPNTDYSFHIANGVIQDLAGNNFASLDTTISIRDSGPLLYHHLYREGPLLWDGSRFKVDDPIVLRFDELVTAGNGKIIITNGTDNRIIDINDASQVTIDSEQGLGRVTINPILDLIPNTNYSVQIASGVITDLLGNAYVGMGIDEESAIKITPQVSNPLLEWSNPWNNSFFRVDDDLIFQFDEEVVPGSGSITISNGSDTRIVDIHDATQVSYADDTHKIGKINLADELIPNSNYSLQITEGVIMDKAGNPYLDIGTSIPINFTTISSNPNLSFTNFDWSDPTPSEKLHPLNPIDDQTSIDPASPLSLEKFGIDSALLLAFDEQVMAGHGKIVISNADGSDVRNIAIDDTNQVTFDEMFVIINPLSDLLPDTTYHIQMSRGVIVDTSGNPYDGVQDDTTLDFVTGDFIGIGYGLSF